MIRKSFFVVGVWMALLLIGQSLTAQSEFQNLDSAFTHLLRYDLEGARQNLTEQRQVFRGKENGADFLINYSRFLYKNQDLDSAALVLQSARELIEPFDSPRLARCFRQQALVEYKRGELVASNALAREGASLPNLDGYAKGRLHNILISNLLYEAEYDSAQYYAWETISALKKDGIPFETWNAKRKRLLVHTLFALGNSSWYQVRFDSALYYYDAASRVIPPSDSLTHAQCYGLIANVLVRKGDEARAIQYYRKGIAILEAYPPGIPLIHDYFNLANAYETLPDLPQAREYYGRALRLAHAQQYALIEANAHLGIGSVYFQMGELDSAGKWIDISLPLLKQAGDEGNYSRAISLASQVHLGQGNLASALELGREAHALAQAAGALDLVQASTENLYQIFLQRKESDSALAYFQTSQALRDSINGLAVQQNIDALEVRYRTRLRAAENEALLVKVEQEGREKRFWQWGAVLLLLVAVLASILILNVLRLRKQKILQKEKALAHEAQLRAILLRKLEAMQQSVVEAQDAISNLEQEKSQLMQVAAPEQLLRKISDQSDWVSFIADFELVYPDFFGRVRAYSLGTLSKTDRRLLAFIKLGLTNKEIAAYSFISVDAVKKAKNRLFKKLEVPASYEKPTEMIMEL